MRPTTPAPAPGRNPWKVFLTPEMTVDDGRDLLLETGAQVAAVVDRKGRRVGVVTRADLVGETDDAWPDLRLSGIPRSERAELGLGSGFHLLSLTTVGEIMRRR